MFLECVFSCNLLHVLSSISFFVTSKILFLAKYVSFKLKSPPLLVGRVGAGQHSFLAIGFSEHLATVLQVLLLLFNLLAAMQLFYLNLHVW
jgi:hypothetical protein